MATGQQQIRITITAVDRATKVITQVNNKLAKMMEPMTRFGRSLKQFGEASGITAFGKQLGNVAGAANRVAQQIGGVITRIAELVGIGSIAGIAAVAAEWGRLGFEITQTSNMIGVSTQNMQQWRSGARLFGISSSIASAALKSMGDTMEDAIFGRNQQALVLMNRMGIGLHHTATGAVDASRGLMDLRRAMQDPAWRGNRQAQGMVARAFGAEGMMPMLLADDKTFNSSMAEGNSTGANQSDAQIEKANQFGVALFRAEQAAAGLRNTIGAGLVPVLQPLLEQFVQWEIANKDFIAKSISDFVAKMVVEIPKLARSVDDLVQGIGGWGTAAKIAGGIMLVNLLAPTITLGLEVTKLAAVGFPALVKAVMAFDIACGTAATTGGMAMFASGLARLGLLGLTGYAAYEGTKALREATWAGSGFDNAVGSGMESLMSVVPFSDARRMRQVNESQNTKAPLVVQINNAPPGVSATVLPHDDFDPYVAAAMPRF